jgi:uncharacterized phiE125 gp8 family phage protein
MKGLELVAQSPSPVSLADFKTFLKIDGNDEDSFLNLCINSAVSAVEKHIKRVLVNSEFNLNLDIFPPVNENSEYRIFNASELYLPNPPAIEIKSIKTYNEGNVESTFSPLAYQVDLFNGRIFLNDGYVWPTDLRNKNAVKINYTCGYGVCPDALIQAVMVYAGQLYNSRCDCSMSDSIKTILSQYRIYDGLGY